MTHPHPDLRAALLREALAVIAESGPQALGLRELARRTGVSHAAPGHHFGSRAGLIAVIAVEGHRALAKRLLAAAGRAWAGDAGAGGRLPGPPVGVSTGASGGSAAGSSVEVATGPPGASPAGTPAGGGAGLLLELAVAYVDFAVEHPASLAVMHRDDLVVGHVAEVVAARRRVEAVLREAVARSLPGASAAERELGAVAVWSFAHGAASLLTAGALPPALSADPAAAVRGAAEQLVRLLAPAAAPVA